MNCQSSHQVSVMMIMMDFVSMKPNCNFLLFIYLFFIITVANIFANTISDIIGAGYHDLFSI